MADKKTHYFVIMGWKDKDGNFVFDHDGSTQEARFPEGNTWNDETDEWEKNYEASDEAYLALVQALDEQGIYDGII